MHSTFEHRLGTGRKAVAFGFFVVLALTFLAFVGSAQAGIESAPPPQIWSDKADYAPGETVVLSGVNWAPGESVHIRVNDDAGASWSHDDDAMADGAGTISHQFDLPTTFAASYTVTATSATGTATTSFTDGNVKVDVAPTGATAQFVETLYSASASCAGAAKSGFPKTLNGSNGDNVGVGNNESIRLDAAATSDQGGAFIAWSSTDSPASPFTVFAGTGGKSICIPGFQSGTKNYRATYQAAPPANAAPVIARDNASVTVNEGVTAANTGTWSDANAGDTVTLSASLGTVTKSGTNASGTWSWSFGTTDGPDQSQTVTITANDGAGGSTTTTFSLTVNNVAPTVALSAGNDLSVNEGAAEHTYSYTISDPGADTLSSVSTSCGANGAKVSGSDTNTNTSGSFKCTFADGPNNSTVSVQATDSDSAAGNTATQTVAVANVAPTVALSAGNDLAVNEGAAEHTYAYTISDPGADTVTSVATSCGANGAKVSGSDTNTNTAGSFKCTFADGPNNSTVSVQATDSDSAAGNTATQTVTVNNVAPTVVLSGAGSVNEGSTHTYSYIVTDPGQDSFTVSAGFPTCGSGGSVAGTPSTTASGGSFDCFFPDGPDTTSVAIKVADSDGASGTDSESVVVVQVANVNPNVSAPDDQAANEGASSSFNLGSFSDPGPDSPWAVDVDWGDGSTHGTASKTTTGSLGSMSHTYADGPATRTVTVTVTDKNGGVGSASFQVTVENVAPTVVLSGDTSANEGSSHTYTYTVSDPGDDPNPTVSESCGTGTKTDTAAANSFDCFFPDGPENATVSVEADDGDASNNTGSDSKTVAVANVAPTVALSAGNDLAVNEGAAEHTYAYTISDPGADTVTSVATSCGANGAKVSGSDTNTNTAGSFKCTFADGPNNSTVSVQATDSDSAAGNTATQTVTVNNVAPTVVLSGAGSVNEGSTHTYSYIVTDPGQDSFTVSAGFPTCGSGGSVAGTPSTTASGGSFDCFFPDGPDTTSVAIKVADSDGASGTDSESVVVVQVANVNPNVSAPDDQAANEGASSSFNLGSFSDPGPDSPWAVDVDWGDGSTHGTASKTTTGSLGSMSHTYADGPATRTVTVTVTDKNGGVGSASFQVTVENVAPTVVLSGDTSANEGSSHTYTYTVSDPGDDPNPTVSESCGTGTKTDTAAANSFDCFFPDGPENATVSVEADDGDASNNTGSDSKTVAVANVAPTVALSAGNDLAVNEGAAEHTYAYTISDPGADTVTSVATSCGANGAKVSGSDTNTNTAGSFKCTFADGPNNSTVSVQATDSDSAAGNTATQTVTVNNVAPTATLGNNGPVDEGSPVSVSFSDQFDPSAGDTTAGFHYAYACDNSSLSSATYAGSGTAASKSCTFGDNGSNTVRARIIDRNGGYTEYLTVVTVRNVNPTASNASFTIDPILGTATAGFDFSDVGWLDTHGSSYFSWSGFTNQTAVVTEENIAPNSTGHASDTRALNPGCYNLTVTGTAKDDDGGTSAPLAIYSNSATSVHTPGFRPPIMDNERNIAKYGNVVPVKVTLTNTCTGATVTNASLYITLAKGVGDEAVEDTNVIAESVSAADTGSQMRTADGMYIFNLSTKNLSANSDWTIRVRLGSTAGPVLLQAVLYPKK